MCFSHLNQLLYLLEGSWGNLIIFGTVWLCDFISHLNQLAGGFLGKSDFFWDSVAT